MPFIDLKYFLRMRQSPSSWQLGECSQHSDFACHLRLCSCGHREGNLESGPKSLHNSTGSERYPFRKRTNLSSSFKCESHKL